MRSTSALTIYAARASVASEDVLDFDQVVDLEKQELKANRRFTSDLGETPAWEAQLYLWAGEPKPPGWLDFLRSGFGDDLDLPPTAHNSAVVVVRVPWRGRKRLYAVTFGGGRHFLRPGVTKRGYGLRVALNAIYEGDKDMESLDVASRIRQIEARSVGVNTLRTLRQANKAADFEVFEVDPDCDQLQGVTGQPVSAGKLGRRIRGTDNVRLSRKSIFPDLGSLCRQLARYHERKDYQRRFRFVDDFKAETNDTRLGQLEELTMSSLLEDPGKWVFAPPALIDFDEVDRFRFPQLHYSAIEPTVEEILAEWEATSDVPLASLRVEAVDQEGDSVDQWSFLQCLDGQVTLEGKLYVLDGAEYYRIQNEYLAALDEYLVSAVGLSEVDLPDSVREPNKDGELKEITEGDYNEQAAHGSLSYQLLDKKTVTVAGKTSPIEICDLLSKEGHLIHVKRKFASSSLSHLFAQGYVSSELLVDSSGFRAAVREKIGPEAADFAEQFPDEDFVPANFEVVYAIVGDWSDRTLTDLPFFSKVNLRRHARSLRRCGYRVTYAPVNVVDP